MVNKKKVGTIMLMLILMITTSFAGTLPDITGFLRYDSELVCMAGQTQEYDFMDSTFNNVKLNNVTELNVISDIDVTGNLVISGNITLEGNLNKELIGIYGSLINETDTTITTAGTYYPVLGIFNNSPSEGFFYNVTANAIQYNSSRPRYIEFDSSLFLEGDTNAIRVTMAITLNGILQQKGKINIYLKNGDESYTASSTTVAYLENGDQIQIMVTSDGNGDIITFNGLEITARPFFS